MIGVLYGIALGTYVSAIAVGFGIFLAWVWTADMPAWLERWIRNRMERRWEKRS